MRPSRVILRRREMVTCACPHLSGNAAGHAMGSLMSFRWSLQGAENQSALARCGVYCVVGSTYGNHPGSPRFQTTARHRGCGAAYKAESLGADSRGAPGAPEESRDSGTGTARSQRLRSHQARLKRSVQLGSGGDLAGGIARGDIRLYRFAPPDKARPVVVLTRDSALQYLSTATVAPVTSAIRGVPSEVRLDEEDGMKA